MAYGKSVIGGGQPIPLVGGQSAQQKEMIEKQMQIASAQSAFTNRFHALSLAIQATPENGIMTPEKRDSMIFNRALGYEQFILKGRDALTTVKDDEPIQKEDTNPPN